MAPRAQNRQAREAASEPAAPHAEVPRGPAVETPPAESQESVLGDLDVLERLGEEVTWYVYRLTPAGTKVQGVEGEPAYALRFKGAFDLEFVAEKVGGGRFEILGRGSNGIKTRRTIAIEGAPRFVRPAVEPPPAPAASAPADIQRLEQRLEQQLGELRRLIEAKPAAAPQHSVDDLIKIARELRPEKSADAAPASPTSPRSMIGDATQVLDLAERMAEKGGTPSSPVAAVLRESLPRVLDLLEQLPIFQGKKAAAPGAAVPAASAGDGNVLVAMLVRAIANGRNPADVADATEELLSDAELAQIRAVDTDLVLHQLKPARTAYPQLATPEAEQWVRAWHHELKNPPADEGTRTAP